MDTTYESDVSTIQSETTETSQVETETQDTSASETSQETDEQDTSEQSQETETEQTATESIDYEKQYKELQAEYTRKSQEFADFKRQHEQPSIIDDRGNPTSQFEKNFNYQLDNYEFSSYLNLARGLDPEDRQEVEDKLDMANRAYVSGNTQNYRALMNEVKQYFNPEYIEQIRDTINAEKSKKDAYIQQAVYQQRQDNAIRMAEEISKDEALNALVNPDIETYSKPVFDIVHQLFNLTGGLDIKLASEAINAIKQQAITEYKASLAINSQKQQAGVLSGDTQVKETKEVSLDDKSFWEKMYS